MTVVRALPGADDCETETWAALGTTVLVRAVGPVTPELRAAVQGEIAAIDRAASRFRDDSELSRVNAAAGTRMAVSPLFAQALELGLRAAEVTGGAVDPTLGESLVNAGYDRDWQALAPIPDGLPAPRRLVVVRRRAGLWRTIEVWDDPPSVRVPAGVRLDLGATAKALAADRAADAAHAASGRGVLVSLGGDIATAGTAPAADWAVHVTDDHRHSHDAPGQTITIRSGGLATSSTTTRRWLHDGQAMHHILDPRHGAPARSRWRTVSVAAATCADANIASTAAIVLGDGAPEWLAEQGLPARLVADDGTALRIGGWPE